MYTSNLNENQDGQDGQSASELGLDDSYNLLQHEYADSSDCDSTATNTDAVLLEYV